MAKWYLRRIAASLAVAALAGVFTAGAPAVKGGQQSAATPLIIHADFNSDLIAPGNQPPECLPPFLLVIGHGTGSGTHISDHAVGEAAECSLPTVDANGAPIFDVHGKGTYTTPDGSVLHLIYHEQSENPFVLPPKPPPDPQWILHDDGQWDIDPNLSTGRFHGATGHGRITAEVPIFCNLVTFVCTAHVLADYVGTISFPASSRDD